MKKWVLIGLLSVLLASCVGVTTQVEIDWVDFVKFNDVSYVGSYSKELTSEQYLGEVVSVVQFKVADNVTDSNYKTKNGDAAFHEKGTKIYEVKGVEDMYAVKDDGKVSGYQIYEESMKNEFENVEQTAITKIEIHQWLPDGSYKLQKELKEQAELTAFLALLNTSVENIEFEPKSNDKDPDYYELLFYNAGPIVNKYSLHYDGETYYWYPFEVAILDSQVGEYLQ